MARLAWVQLLALLVTFVASFILAAVYGSALAARWVGVTMVAVLFVLIVSGWFVSSMGARVAAEIAATRGAGRWTFDREGVRVESALSTTAFRWEMVEKVAEEGDRFIFALNPASNAILPLRSLVGDQVEDLRSLIGRIEAEGRFGAGTGRD